MIKVTVTDPGIRAAYWNALRALPRIELERPRQYFARWNDHYKCKISGYDLIFDREEDYTWFVLKWG